MVDTDEEIPENLKTLAAELDLLGGVLPAGPGLDGLPDLGDGDFRLIACVGRGGMGTVYKAEQVSLGRLVAVKLLAGAWLDDPGMRHRFADEARLVARLHHPHITHVYAARSQGPHPFFAMEFIDGESADQSSFSSVREIAEFALPIAEALAYAHACGVIHRDVKPSNLFRAVDGTPKLGDFGLACLSTSTADSQSGTRKYMSPERLAGEAASELDDQYAFGASILELAAKSPDFNRTGDFAAILGKACASNPSARYVNMETLAGDFQRLLAGEPVLANPPSPVRRLRLWRQRNPAAALGIGTTILATLGLIAALVVGYVRTSTALRQTEAEAAHTAQALVAALTATASDGDSSNPAGKRLAKLKRALEIIEELERRYPDNDEMSTAATRLRRAIEFTERRGEHPRGKIFKSP